MHAISRRDPRPTSYLLFMLFMQLARLALTVPTHGPVELAGAETEPVEPAGAETEPSFGLMPTCPAAIVNDGMRAFLASDRSGEVSPAASAE